MNALPRVTDFVRTDESAFAHIPDFPYTPHYTEVGGLRIACIDEGPRDAPVVLLMHGEPLTMQVNPMSEPPAAMPVAVASFLMARTEALLLLGVAGERIVLDPGIGFGKTVAQNYALLPGQQALRALGFPVLAGWSRKSALGAVTGRAVDERLSASVAASTIALTHGANVLRVHDVAATRDAVRVWLASQ